MTCTSWIQAARSSAPIARRKAAYSPPCWSGGPKMPTSCSFRASCPMGFAPACAATCYGRGWRWWTQAPAPCSWGSVVLARRACWVDAYAVCDGHEVYIGAVMQHVEEAGVHSGDSACVIPSVSLGDEFERLIEEQTAALALELGVIGLMNVQYALQQTDESTTIFVLEVNPRGSRTVPFVSKATGVPLARVATKVIAGHRLSDLDLPGGRSPSAPAACRGGATWFTWP